LRLMPGLAWLTGWVGGGVRKIRGGMPVARSGLAGLGGRGSLTTAGRTRLVSAARPCLAVLWWAGSSFARSRLADLAGAREGEKGMVGPETRSSLASGKEGARVARTCLAGAVLAILLIVLAGTARSGLADAWLGAGAKGKDGMEVLGQGARSGLALDVVRKGERAARSGLAGAMALCPSRAPCPCRRFPFPCPPFCLCWRLLGGPSRSGPGGGTASFPLLSAWGLSSAASVFLALVLGGFCSALCGVFFGGGGLCLRLWTRWCCRSCFCCCCFRTLLCPLANGRRLSVQPVCPAWRWWGRRLVGPAGFSAAGMPGTTTVWSLFLLLWRWLAATAPRVTRPR
jgi:hypothetical protein